MAVACVFVMRPAAACGGGGVTTSTSGGVVADSQRVVLALRDVGTEDERTEIIAQVGVPAAGEAYGVLIPVPGEPTIDPEPVSIEDLDELDRATAPQVTVVTPIDDGGGSGSGCGCGSADDDSAGAADSADANVIVSAPVNLGPATVVVLQADDPAALTDWLDANGFAIPAEHEALVASYVDAGHSFIALKRSDDAPSDGPSSLGLHYTLAGDHRQLSLAFARLGAAPSVAFTVFVTALAYVTPDPTFKALTLYDLDPVLLQQSYRKAVAQAVSKAGARAFVIESTLSSPLMAALSSDFRALLGYTGSPANVTTRLTTVVAASALDSDVRLDGSALVVPSKRTIDAADTPSRISGASTALLALVFAARAWRRRRSAGGSSARYSEQSTTSTS